MERIGKAISQLKLSALFRIEKSLKRMMKSGGKALLTPIWSYNLPFLTGAYFLFFNPGHNIKRFKQALETKHRDEAASVVKEASA